MDLWTGLGILLAIVALAAPVTPGFQNPWVVAGIWFAVVSYAAALLFNNSGKVASAVAAHPTATTLISGTYAFLLVAGLVHTYVVPKAVAISKTARMQDGASDPASRSRASKDQIDLRWTHGNTSTLTVTNNSTDTLRDVHIVVKEISFFHKEKGRWVTPQDLDEGFFSQGRRLYGTGHKLAPLAEHNVPFIQTMYGHELALETNEPGKYKRQRLTQAGRRMVKLSVLWAPDNRRDLFATFKLGKTGQTSEPESDFVDG